MQQKNWQIWLKMMSEELSLGTILSQARQRKDIEIVKVSSYLNIKEKDIIAIENNQIEEIAKYVYVPGLIRSYGKFLGISKEIIDQKLNKSKIKSNVENKKHELVNIGENNDLSPEKEDVFEFLAISVILFLILLTIYNFNAPTSNIITNQEIVGELENFKK